MNPTDEHEQSPDERPITATDACPRPDSLSALEQEFDLGEISQRLDSTFREDDKDLFQRGKEIYTELGLRDRPALRYFLCHAIQQNLLEHDETTAILLGRDTAEDRENTEYHGFTEPAPECSATLINVVETLLAACSGPSRHCPDEIPLPPDVDADSYEHIMRALPTTAAFFATGQSTLTRHNQDRIYRFIGEQIYSGSTVLIIARASRVGDEFANRHLAQARGEQVRDYLLSRVIPDENGERDLRLEIFNYGENSLYMNLDSPLAADFQEHFEDQQHLNQSVWVAVYECNR